MRVPAYRKKTVGGHHYAVVTLNRKDHTLGKFDFPESHAKYRQLIARHVAGEEPQAADQPQIKDLALAYLEYAERYYLEGSEFAQMKRVVAPLYDLFGESLTKDFGPKQFQVVREHWCQDKSRSRQYVNKQMGRLKMILKWATGEGLLPPNNSTAIACIAGLKPGRTVLAESKPKTWVDPSKVDRTTEVMTPVLRDLVRFQRLTGCRPGEACAITPGIIDRSGDVCGMSVASRLLHRLRADQFHEAMVAGKCQAQDRAEARDWILGIAESVCERHDAHEAEAVRHYREQIRRLLPHYDGQRLGSQIATSRRLTSEQRSELLAMLDRLTR